MLTHTQVIPMQTLQFIVAVNPNFCRDWNCIFQVLWDWALVKKWWSWRHGVAIYRNRFINPILSGQDQFCVFQWSCPHLERCYILLYPVKYPWFQWVSPHVCHVFWGNMSSLLNVPHVCWTWHAQGAAWQWALWLLCDGPTGTQRSEDPPWWPSIGLLIKEIVADAFLLGTHD